MPFELELILISFENDIDFDYLLDKLVLGYDRGSCNTKSKTFTISSQENKAVTILSGT